MRAEGRCRRRPFQPFKRLTRSDRRERSLVLTLDRAVDVARRSPSLPDRVASPGPGLGKVGHRHAALAGLKVSPVHGRHCICERCAMRRASTTDASYALRHLGGR